MDQKNIAVGIVLYHPDTERLKTTVLSVRDQAGPFIFVDNGSECENQLDNVLRETAIRDRSKVIVNDQNRGIAAALNQIMQAALDEGIDYILTLDDDSRCDENLVRVLAHCLSYPRAGIICPDAVQDSFTGKQEGIEEEPRRSHHVTLTEDCITAGSLTSVKAWQKSGGFDEKMFIDFVDMDFCAQLREHGYRIYHVSQIAVHQMYGHTTSSFRLFGKTFYRLNYSPVRIYYSVRNQIYYIRKHRRSTQPVRRVLFLIGYIGKHLVFEKNRIACAKAMLRGLCEGVRM